MFPQMKHLRNHINLMHMKKYFLIVFFSTTLAFAFGQSPIEKNGLYYSTDEQLYTGVYTSLRADGTMEKHFQVQDGYLNGPVEFFDEAGNLQETGNYKVGKKDGVWIQYNSKGTKVGEAYYKDGLKDGIWTVWDDNSVKRYHMVYSMGSKVDVWKMWDENSELVSERLYND